ncbi:hypothetical protein [Pollutibacter soli]|uniref:hypothetical protein n=1 Tax=Pollutibacter soli TaxID=3034157 RepID=UPI003013E90C
MQSIRQSTIYFLSVFQFLSGNVSSYAQNRITDSSVTCIAFWKKGEERKLKITHTKSTGSSEADMRSEAALSYEAHVTILDSNEGGYKIRWKFRSPELHKSGDVRNGAGVPIFDGMEFLFSTSEGGMFLELENREQVRDNYKNLFLLSAKDTASASFKSIMEKTMAMFNTRELVENSLIKEIQLYHSLYGLEFSRAAVKKKTMLESPYVSERLPAITELAVTLSPVSTEFITIAMNVQLDRSGTMKVLQEVYKRIGASENDPELKQVIKSMDISERSEHQFRLKDGWKKQVVITRISKTGSIRQAENYLIELLED